MCDPSPSLLIKTTVSQPFAALLGKKITHRSTQLNKGILVPPNRPFYFLVSPLFCEESRSKRDSNCTEQHMRTALKLTASNDLGEGENALYVYVYVTWSYTHAYIGHRRL